MEEASEHARRLRLWTTCIPIIFAAIGCILTGCTALELPLAAEVAERNEPLPRPQILWRLAVNQSQWGLLNYPVVLSPHFVHGDSEVGEPITSEFLIQQTPDCSVVAVDTTGKLRWQRHLGSGFQTKLVDAVAAVPVAEAVYVAEANRLWALQPTDGKAIWSYASSSVARRTPAVGHDGRIYAAISAEGLRGVTALRARNGIPLWTEMLVTDGTEADVRLSISSNLPAGTTRCAASETLLVTACEPRDLSRATEERHSFLAAYHTKNMSLRWNSTLLDGACAESAPTVDEANGIVYVVVHDILAIDACTGKHLWRSSLKGTPRKIISSPTVLKDGTLVFGSMDKQVYAINGSTGAVKWRFATDGFITSTPKQAVDGTIHVGSWDGRFSALDPNGQVLWQYSGTEAFAGSAAVSADGITYAADNSGSIFAMKTAEVPNTIPSLMA